MMDRVYLTSNDPKTQGINQVDATDLATAVVELRNAWREDRGIYSVRVMFAVGKVITASESVFDFSEGGTT